MKIQLLNDGLVIEYTVIWNINVSSELHIFDSNVAI
jgi:hypothetical protein